VSKIGDAVPRHEDYRLLTGQGSYTDDALDGTEAWMVLLRSPYASATITAIETNDAQAAPGVLGIFTRADLDADGVGLFTTAFPFKRADGEDMHRPPFGLLAGGSVNYVGDPVVAVIAETRLQAEDAAELVVVDYDDRAPVTDAVNALEPGAPQVWPEVPGNAAFLVERGDKEATDAVFENAPHVTALDLRITRVTANPIEPRAAIGSYDAETGHFVLRTGTQTPHRLLATLSDDILHITPETLRVISPDVGGAFGMKNSPYPEYALVLWASQKVRRVVAWRSSRIEAMQSDFQGRDNVIHGELALDADGRFLAVRAKSIGNLGAYLGPLTPHPSTANVGGMIGPYSIGAAHVEVTGVHTNTPPTAPYRGAGRPEATYVIERLVDQAACELDMDAVDLRRCNLLTPDQLPHQTPMGMVYDCGDFPCVLAQGLDESDWDGFGARRKQSEANGLLRGRGMAYSIEIAGGPQSGHMPESMGIQFDAGGNVHVLAGSMEIGTGHATAYKQILSDQLGLKAERISVICGDTRLVAQGTGSFGSRTMIAAGTAVVRAGERIIEKGKALAADALEAAEIDMEFSGGAFRVVGTDKAISLHDLAAQNDGALSINVTEKAEGPTYPNGCHVCEVEIDPDTGVTLLDRYCVVDDVGTVINPMIVKGQMHGGIAQGVGQVLMEYIKFDDDSGQLVTGSFLDYCMPRANDFPLFDVGSCPVPTAMNPLGAKGAGEAGTVGALPVVVIATLDALRPYGVKHIDMPLTPERVWQTLQINKS
jgi:aerobic carbon-monoxide dehydrogenase large subunit